MRIAISIFLLFMIGMTNNVVSVQKHFCKGQLQSASILGTPENCHDKAARSSNASGYCGMTTKSCCSVVSLNDSSTEDCCNDEQSLIANALDLLHLQIHSEIEIPASIDFFATQPRDIIVSYEGQMNNHKQDYFWPPPLSQPSINIWLQHFLI